MSASKSLEGLLLENFAAAEHHLFEARRRRAPEQTLVEALIETGVEAMQLAKALAGLYCLPLQVHIELPVIDRNLTVRIPVEYARRNRLLPLASDGTTLFVATADPANYAPLDDLAMLFRMPVQPIVVPFDTLARITEAVYEENRVGDGLVQVVDLHEEPIEAAARLLSLERLELLRWDAAPIIRLVKAIIWEAVSEGAHEIYFEPLEQELMVRFRAGATVYNLLSSPKCIQSAIISCIKVIAGMSTLPHLPARQGYLWLRAAGRILTMSGSVIPHRFGEQVVLRLHAHEHHILDPIAEGRRARTPGSFRADPRIPSQRAVCARCGQSIVVADATFCKNCGAPLSKTPKFISQLPLRPLLSYGAGDDSRADWKLF